MFGQFLDDIFCGTDVSRPSGDLLIDRRKAFDTVDHGILLSKLHAYVLKLPAVSWLKSYLSGCQKVTELNYQLSSACEVNCGEPRGSILGLLLFTLYVNDLPSIITQGSCYLYANDSYICMWDHQ